MPSAILFDIGNTILLPHRNDYVTATRELFAHARRRSSAKRSQFLPFATTYAHSASISSGLSSSPHGGMEFLPFDTEVRKRSR